MEKVSRRSFLKFCWLTAGVYVASRFPTLLDKAENLNEIESEAKKSGQSHTVQVDRADTGLPSKEYVEQLIADGGTRIAKGTPTTESDERFGASFEQFVTGEELSSDEVVFVETPDLTALKNEGKGQFVYASATQKGSVTVFAIDFFTRYDVAEYTATIVDVLNLFRVEGDLQAAKENMWRWCDARTAEATKENGVVCFGPSDY